MITIIGSIALVILITNLAVCMRSLRGDSDLAGAFIRVIVAPTIVLACLSFSILDHLQKHELVEKFDPAAVILAFFSLR